MARNIGTFNFAANLEVLAKAPLDAKQLVGTYADLTNPSTWEDSEGNIWLYNGAIVSVGDDPTPSNNGIYFLNDASDYTSPQSWIRQGGVSGISVENGLTISNENIKLGGDLIENTNFNGQDAHDFSIYNIDEFQVSTSGNTTIFGVDNQGIVLGYSGQSVTFEDDGGLKYGGDYSSGFTDNSLVTKSYVDDAIVDNDNLVNINNPTSTTYNATNSDSFIGVSGGSTVYLPDTPNEGLKIIVADISGDAYDNQINIYSNTVNILDGLEAAINTNYGSITFIYNSMFWSIVAFTG